MDFDRCSSITESQRHGVKCLKKANIKGKIVRTEYRTKLFWIHATKMNRRFKCYSNGFKDYCPLQIGDIVEGEIAYYDIDDDNETFKFIYNPRVELCIKEEHIISTFIRILRGSGFGDVKANKLYDHLAKSNEYEITGENVNKNNVTEHSYMDEKSVQEYISKLSEQWNNEWDEDIISQFTNIITESQTKKLLKVWHRDIDKRRLYILGLNDTKIKKCQM